MLGLTVISIGTALPELIGSIVAATRGYSALAVGSVIGSNLLNVFLVLGVTAYLHPIRLGERMHLVDLVGLVAITLLGVVMLRGSRRISRCRGRDAGRGVHRVHRVRPRCSEAGPRRP